MIDKNKILLIAGSGRNVGKTSFVCKIITQNKNINIVAVKISSHFHYVKNNKPIYSNNNYQVYYEKNTEGKKDSNKMLNAGAKKVFYIQAKDQGLAEAFSKLNNEINFNDVVICESGGLINYIKPKVFIFIKDINEEKIKEKSKDLIPLADGILVFDGKKHIWEKRFENSYSITSKKELNIPTGIKFPLKI